MKTMIKKIMMIPVIFLCVANITFSQLETGDRINQCGFQLGFAHINLEDKALNNAMHKGAGLYGAYYLERTNARAVKVLDLELGSGFLKSDFENETSTYMFSGSAGFSWLSNLLRTSGNTDIYLGGRGEIGTAIEYFDNWDESHFYWMTSYSLGIDFRLEYSFGDNSMISIGCDAPILSLISRPPAEFLVTQSSPALKDVVKDLNHDLEFLAPGKCLDINFGVKYSLRNSKKFIPAIFWKLNYLNIDKNGSGKLKYIDQTIGVAYIF